MKAKILEPTSKNIQRVALALREGRVVGMPTETVYGLAGAAFQPDALARIFETKERPTFDPLIVHVGPHCNSEEALEKQGLIHTSALSVEAKLVIQNLIENFWPGPLTLVLPRSNRVPDLATAGLSTVAIRMPMHPVAQALIEAAGTPLAAPSANRFGRISPTTAQAVADELGDRIELILDGGPCAVGVESTVIHVALDGTLTQLRPGGLARQTIQDQLGISVHTTESTSAPGLTEQAQTSPGMLESHYSPSKTLVLLPEAVTELEPRHWREMKKNGGEASTFGFLLRRPLTAEEPTLEELLHRSGAFTAGNEPKLLIEALTQNGDVHEAARNLFLKLRMLDASSADLLFAEPWEKDEGLGHALIDRLTRAAKIKLSI